MASNGETLCLDCGLCCNGALFSVVVIQPDELRSSHRLKLRVVSADDGRLGIKQPCSACSGDGCTVYAERPGRCRSFRCQLLAEVESGQLSLPEARGIVHVMKEAIRQLELALLPNDVDDPNPLRMRIAMQRAVEELPQHSLHAMLTYDSLNALRFVRAAE